MAKKKRVLSSELNIHTALKGWKSVTAGANKIINSIQVMKDLYKATEVSAKDYASTNVDLGQVLTKQAGVFLQSNFLFNELEDQIKGLSDGTAHYSDLTERQIELLKLSLEKQMQVREELYKQGDANEELIEFHESRLRLLQDTIKEQNRYAKTFEFVDKYAGQASGTIKELFGGLKSGSAEGDKIFRIFSDTLSKVSSQLDPLKKKAKGMLADMMMKGGEQGSPLKDYFGKIKDGLSDKVLTKSSKAIKITTGETKGLIRAQKGLSGSSKAIRVMAGETQGLASSQKVLTGAARSAGTAMGQAGASATAMGAALGPVVVVAAAAVAYLALLYTAAKLLVEGFNTNVETMEAFRLANFRSAGSIRELTDTTYQLTQNLGTTTAESKEMVSALVSAGLAVNSMNNSLTTANGTVLQGQEALKHLARENLMFTVATGASADVTAMFSKRMVEATGSAEDHTSSLATMVQAAENMGLTGADLNKVMQALTESTIKQEVYYKKSKIGDFNKAVVGLSAVAKQAGLDVSVATDFIKQLTDLTDSKTIALLSFGGALGEAFKINPDQVKLLEGGLRGTANIMKMFERTQGVVRENAMAQWGITVERQKLLEGLIGLEGEAREQKLQSILAGQAELKKEQDEAAELGKAYDKSISTITQRWQRMFVAISNFASEYIGPVVDYVIDILEDLKEPFQAYIMPVLKDAFDIIMTAGRAFWDLLKPFMPLFKVIAINVYVLTRAFLKIVKVVQLLTWAFFKLFTIPAMLVNVLIDQIKDLFKLLGIDLSFSTAMQKINDFFGWFEDKAEKFKNWLKDNHLGFVADAIFGKTEEKVKESIKATKEEVDKVNKNGGIELKTVPADNSNTPPGMAQDASGGFNPLSLVPGIGMLVGLSALKDAKMAADAKMAKDAKMAQDVSGGFNPLSLVPGIGMLVGLSALKDAKMAADAKMMAQDAKIAQASLSALNDARMAADAAPIRTVATNNSIQNSNAEENARMMASLRDIAKNTKAIAEKDDPNNKRAADAVEELVASNNKSKRSDNLFVRRQKYTLGEEASNWYADMA